MSDENEKKGDEAEFDLDWDDALADWEKDVESGSAVAKSGPMPQKAGAPAAPSRALYQPPDASEIARMRGGRPGAGAPPAAPPAAAPRPSMPTAPPPPGAAGGLGSDPYDDDDDGGSTRIASIPREMIERLAAGGPLAGSGAGRSSPAAAPAPPPPEPPARTSAVDLDIDGLLEGLDGETMHYPAEVPRMTRPVHTSSAPGVEPPLPQTAAMQTAAMQTAAMQTAAMQTAAMQTAATQTAATQTAATPPPPAPPADAAPSRGPSLPYKPSGPLKAATELARAVARAAPPKPGAAGGPVRPPPPVPRPPGSVPRVPLPASARVAVPTPGRPPVPAPASPPAAAPAPAQAPVRAASPTAPPAKAPAEDDIDALLSALDLPEEIVSGPAPSADVSESSAEAAFFDAPIAHRPPSIRPSIAEELGDLSLDSEPPPPMDVEAPPPAVSPAPPVAAPPAAPPPTAPATDPSATGRPSIAERLRALAPKRDVDQPATPAPIVPPVSIAASISARISEEASRVAPAEPDGTPTAGSAADGLPAEVSADPFEAAAVEDELTVSVGDETDIAFVDEDEGEPDAELAAALAEEASAEAAAAEAAAAEAARAAEASIAGDAAIADLEPAVPARPTKSLEADRGAQAARRSVRSRKPRKEHFPLVGLDVEARRAQLELLVRLIEPSKGPARARVCLAASELAIALGDSARGFELRDQARAADPKDPLALRSVRRAAQARSAWDEVRSALRDEADLSFSDAHRALTLAALAELELGPLGDASAAASTAVRAMAAWPGSTAAALTLHDALVVRAPSDRVARAQGLAALARATQDDRVAGIFAGEHLRAAERAGIAPLTELETPAELGAIDVDGLLVRARLFSKEGRKPLSALAMHFAPADLADAARRLAATAAARDGDAALALETIGHPDDASLPSLRTMSRLAAKTGDRARELAALRAWASASSGSERAAALARAAEMHVEDDDLDLAEMALRDAALADASLGTLRMVRQKIVRKDPARAGRAEGSEGALALAARLAPDPEQGDREAELLEKARGEEDAPVTADVLSLDAALAQEARTGPTSAASEGLVRQIERTPSDARTAGLISLADRHARAGNTESAESALRDARSLSPGDPLVVRQLAALVRHRSQRDAAALYLEEASAAPDVRAAFAASVAGRLLEGDEAVAAHRRALDARREHAPSIAELERLARLAGDAKLLEEALDRGAEIAATPLDRAAQLVRLALVRAGEDPTAAGVTFEQARAIVPDDAVLVDLAMRLGDALTTATRASLTERAAARAPSGLAPAYRLAHAAALEDAGDPVKAAETLRSLLEEADTTVARAAARALDRVDIASGDHARVAERRFQTLRTATTALDALDADAAAGEAGVKAIDARVRALEALAMLDLEVRGDAGAAVASLAAILEARPQHVPALRALERHAMDGNRPADLAPVEEALSTAVPDSIDARAHLRSAARLRLSIEGAVGASADSVVLGAAEHVRRDAWTLRRVAAAARAVGDRARASEADLELAETLAGPSERASIAREAARNADTEPLVQSRLAAQLGPFADAAPSHPTIWEVLAEVRLLAGEQARAVDALEAAARASAVPSRKVAFFHRAAVVAADDLDDEDRSIALLEEAAKVDVSYADVFDRSRVILERRGNRAKLSELVALRASAGGDGTMLVDLHLVNAALRQGDGDIEGAKAALRSALAIAPEKVEALRKLAQLSLADEDYRSAADALIRIARVRKDREELRWVFFTLGDIYDRHIPDPKRAEAAFLRVLKLEPEDLPAMERLAALYQKDNQHVQAAEQLEKLAKAEVDPDKARRHQLSLARVLENAGDARKAEQVLEIARRAGPTELETLRGLAEFYGRQKAQTALAMHLNRAVSDFRHALVTDVSDTAVWLGLVEVLGWRGKKDAARAAASAAMALGIVDVELSKLVDATGGAPGAGARGADAELDDLLSPPTLSPPTRAVFRLLGPSLEKVLPFDPRTLRAEKLGPKDTSVRPLALEIGRWMGISDVEIWLAPTAGRVCMPVSSQPVAIVVGRDLLAADEHERAFLLARALRVAKSQLTLAMYTKPADLAALLGGLVLNFDPHFAPPGVDPALAQDFMKRVARQLPRRAAEDIAPVVFEMWGAQDYEPTRLPLAVSEYGDRAALLMTGGAPAALSALLKLAGEPKLPADPAARAAMVRRSGEAASLLAFAISDAYFEARHRSGLDRG